jgi:hypothetical protein
MPVNALACCHIILLPSISPANSTYIAFGKGQKTAKLASGKGPLDTLALLNAAGAN